MMKSNPRSFGVPHDSWRGGQYETVEFIRDSSERVVIAEAPVGSGKSAVAGALGAFGKSRTLTRTIALQKQYAETYGFEPLYGMKNYICHLNELFNADSCAFPEKMHDCPVSAMCQYLRRREIVKNSRRQSLSYAYYMVANWPYEPPFVSYLYCDEAHLLPGIIRDFNSVVFTPKMVRKMNIGMYPTATIKNHAIRLKKAIEWMSEVSMHFKMEWNKLQAIPKAERTQSISTRMRRLNEHIRRLSIMIDRGDNSPRDIFVSWSKDEFKVVPLTARYFFTPKFTSVFHKTVLTSATIGNPDVLAAELGIKNFAYRSVPSNFPPKSMPVYLLEDAPKLNYRSGESAKKKHAKLIADIFRERDPGRNGLIHVSSRFQANDLANRLSRMGLQDRVYVADQQGTEAKMNSWRYRMAKFPNTITLSYSFHEGFDNPDGDINVVAKIPFKMLDEIGRAELNYNPKMYTLDAAIKTQQACGRTRRGRDEHYEMDGEPERKVVAIADGNYQRIENMLSPSFKECVVSY